MLLLVLASARSLVVAFCTFVPWPWVAGFVVVASTIRLTQYGEAVPRIVSMLTWTAATPLRPIPKGISYEEYLCCDIAVDWGCHATLCDPSRPDRRDPYVKERRWAPRRNHAAVTIKVGGSTAGGPSLSGGLCG
jgi:hypothetical protein